MLLIKPIKAGEKVVGVAVPVVLGVASKVTKNVQKVATDKAMEVITEVGKAITKK